MPSLARSARAGSVKARPTMNRATVNPIPATAATPSTWRQPVPRGRRPQPRRTASQVKAEMPTSFPASSPSAVPRATG